MAAKKRVSCKSFSTQKEAQQWYNQRKRSGQTGWKALDRDKDGGVPTGWYAYVVVSIDNLTHHQFRNIT